MNDFIPVQVECHAGYKAGEYPVCFYWENIRFEIREILDRWYQGESNPGFPAANYFKVITTDQKTFILKNEISTDRWFILIFKESLNL